LLHAKVGERSELGTKLKGGSKFRVSLYKNLLHVAPKWGKHKEAEHAGKKHREMRSADSSKGLQRQLMVGFEPVKLYVSELEQRFGHLALFFHDVFAGRHILMVWRPRSFLPAAFKVTKTSLLIPVRIDGCKHKQKPQKAKDAQAIPNISEVLSEIRSIGEGVVSRVALS
jgi:hypothetical protein